MYNGGLPCCYSLCLLRDNSYRWTTHTKKKITNSATHRMYSPNIRIMLEMLLYSCFCIVMWLKKLKEQYDREYNKFCEYDPEKYIIDAHIVFINGDVVHTNLYYFVISEDGINLNCKKISPNDIDHVTYIIEELPQHDEEDIEN